MEDVKISFDNYSALEEICKKTGSSIQDLLQRLIIYSDITRNLLELPPEITIELSIIAATINKLLPMWMDNLSNNIEKIRSGKDISAIQKPQKPALVIGAGPSLKRNSHLELIADKGFDGIIFATDRILKDCLDANIIPDYVIIIDGSDKILKYLDHRIVDDYADKLKAIMTTHTHPSVVNRWHGDIYWYNNEVDDTIIQNVNQVLHLITKKSPLPNAGHVSSLGWCMAGFLNCNPIVLTGLDLSYPLDTPIEETWYYNHHLKQCNGDKKKARLNYKKYHHKSFNTDCYFEPMFEFYINNSLSQLTELAKAGFKIYNCTEGGAIEGEGIDCIRLSEYLERHNTM